MAEFTVLVPDQDVAQFVAWANEKKYAFTSQSTDAIPEWQKREVLETIASTKLEDYIAWEDVKAKHFKSA
jgi:hypothetical protein